jgi:O-antigen/teichoic acid export membrane protein
MTALLQRSLRSPTVRTVSGLAGSNLLALGVAAVGTLVQARYVGPADLGYFRTFSIATGYALLLQLGLDDALQRRFPYHMGQGRRDQALAVAEVCQAWNIIISGIVGSAFVICGAVVMCFGNWRAALGWWSQAVAMVSLFYGAYLAATYRSGHDFATVAKGGVVSSVVNLAVLPLFPIFAYLALVLRSTTGALFNLVYLHRCRPLRLPWRFSWPEWWRYVVEGMPIFTAGYGRSMGYTVAESTIVLSFLGAGPLGIWSFSTMALESANKIPLAITAVYVPRLVEHYGRTHDIRACLELCRAPLVLGTLAMGVLAGFCCAATPLVVRTLMPKYVAAIPTIWLMMAVLPLLVLELPYTLLVAMGRFGQQNISVYAGWVAFLLLAICAVRMGLGVTGVVAASLGGRLIRLATTYLFVAADWRRSIIPSEPGLAAQRAPTGI